MKQILLYPQHEMIDNMIEQFFGDTFNNQKINSKYPLTDVYEEDGFVYMEIALAGFSKENISIELDNQTLIVKGLSNKENVSGRDYLKRDIATRSFEKVYKLLVEIDNVEATFIDGILKIKLIPRKYNEPISKKIEIK